VPYRTSGNKPATPLKMNHPTGGLFCVRFIGFSIHRNMSPLLTFNVMREALTHGTFESTSPPSQQPDRNAVGDSDHQRRPVWAFHSIPRLGGGLVHVSSPFSTATLQVCSLSVVADGLWAPPRVRAHRVTEQMYLFVNFSCAAIPFSSTRMPSRADGRAQRSAVDRMTRRDGRDDLDFRLARKKREMCFVVRVRFQHQLG
jgi:hypothetical protein